MVHKQRVIKQKAKTGPVIVDERTPKVPSLERVPGIPCRSVLYVEVGDTATAQVQQFLARIRSEYTNAEGGLHYVLPLRHGKIGSDVVFEEEFLNVVREMCEVRDGNIVLKNGAQEVRVTRSHI